MSTEDISDFRGTASIAARMHQEPKDRLWGAIYAVAILVFLLGAISVTYAETTKNYLEGNRELAFQRGSVDCLQVVIDNDRDFGLPSYCAKSEVIVFFPPEVCNSYFRGRESCGSRWDEE